MSSVLAQPSPAGGVGVLAIIVLYKTSPAESEAWKSLQLACATLPAFIQRISVILYANSVDAESPPSLPDYAKYEASPKNAGLARPYNWALERARSQAFPWLLTLDQDTYVPADFFVRVGAHLHTVGDLPSVGAVVPYLIQDDKVLSPRRVLLGRTKPVGSGYTGIRQGEIQAFNSGTLWRTSALCRIGGFCEYFWLDHLDIWMHHQLHLGGLKSYLAGDVRLRHSLSLIGAREQLSSERYKNFLEAESAFWDLCGGPLPRGLMTARLLVRLARQRMRRDDITLQRLTLTHARERIIIPRRERIRRWEGEMLRRGLTLQPGIPVRPRISVCMASYNGERFIAAQLRSILSQLTPTDEVIVVDDCSSDGTRERVKELTDPRIRLIESKENRGVFRAFETSISSASGDLVFLSDQDDVWEDDKVATVLQAFRENPWATLVMSDASFIDENDLRVPGTYYRHRGRFTDSFVANLLRGKYHGCLMAIRASVLIHMLPFPKGFDLLHDYWIGFRNRLSGGGTVYIDRPLVRYRRHSNNATGNSKLSRLRQFRIRLHILLALILFSRRKSA